MTSNAVFELACRSAMDQPGWNPGHWTSLPEGPTLVTLLLLVAVVVWHERQWWGRNPLAVARQRQPPLISEP